MGVKLRAFGVCNTDNAFGNPYSDYPPVWIGSGKYDWRPLDAMVDDLIEASPEAEFLCLVDLNSPRWLARQMRLDSFDTITHVCCHPQWRDETSKYLKALVERVESRWGDRVKAYLLMAGQTTEWFENSVEMMTARKDAAWSAWCTARGLEWREVAAPSMSALRSGAFEGVMYDPAIEGEKIDWWRFHNSLTADALLQYAHDVRSIVGLRKQIGAFFGYYFICNKQLATQGHLDYERVIASPDIDFLSSPATYTDRGCGFGTGSMAVAGTLRRYGKRLLHEIDFWPDTLTPPIFKDFRRYFHNPAETLAGNTREAAFALVNGMSWWWFDMWGNMYTDPVLRRRIARFAKLKKRYASLPPSTPDADILMVADPDSAYYMVDPAPECPDGFAPALGCGEQIRNVANCIGAVIDTCSFDDLVYVDLSRIRLVCLPATWTITPAKEKTLRDFVCRDGRTVLWTYAPGVSDGRTADAARVSKWTGAEFKAKGITSVEMGGWTAAYAYDYRDLTPEAMRGIAMKAGVHFYADELLPIMSNGRILAVHCGSGGEKTIRLRKRCAKVVDILEDREVAGPCTSFHDSFLTPDTKLYELIFENETKERKPR